MWQLFLDILKEYEALGLDDDSLIIQAMLNDDRLGVVTVGDTIRPDFSTLGYPC